MAYFKRQELVTAAGGDDAFVQLTDWNGDGVPDDDVIEQYTQEAEGLIESLAIRYETPFDNPSKAVRFHAAHETVYLLAAERGRLTDAMDRMRELREHWYAKLSEGKVKVSESDTPKNSRRVVESHAVTSSSLPESIESSGYR